MAKPVKTARGRTPRRRTSPEYRKVQQAIRQYRKDHDITSLHIHHVGGGTTLMGEQEFPSDDEYEDTYTKDRFVFDCTVQAHFMMPHKIGSIEEIFLIPGVSSKYTHIVMKEVVKKRTWSKASAARAVAERNALRAYTSGWRRDPTSTD